MCMLLRERHSKPSFDWTTPDETILCYFPFLNPNVLKHKQSPGILKKVTLFCLTLMFHSSHRRFIDRDVSGSWFWFSCNPHRVVSSPDQPPLCSRSSRRLILCRLIDTVGPNVDAWAG